MKAYHFLPANYGLANLQRRHLKVATIPELNDPFELLCLDLSDPELRSAMRAWKAEIGRRFGLLCFSRTWRNPVQWSHYADRHRGLCLGFELPESDYARDVTYSGRRSVEEARRLFSDKTTELGTHEEPVTLRNARLAFRTYRVTTQHDRALWA